MNVWKDRIMKDWGFMRIIRLTLACIALYEAWRTYDVVLSLVGFFLMYQSIFNVGCCGSNGCGIDPSKNKLQLSDIPSNEIIFTEVTKK